MIAACLLHRSLKSSTACCAKALQAEFSCHHNNRVFDASAPTSDLSSQVDKLRHADLIH